MNSKATWTRLMAFSTESTGASQGRSSRARPERIGARAAERVPIGDAEAEMVLHRLAFDDLVGIVVVKGERILRLRTLVADLRDFGKCGHGSGFSLEDRIVRCSVIRRGTMPPAQATIVPNRGQAGNRPPYRFSRHGLPPATRLHDRQLNTTVSKQARSHDSPRRAPAE